MKLRLCILMVALAATSSTFGSEWTGTASDGWFDSTNWTAGVPNASIHSIRINTTSPNSTLIDGGEAFTGSSFGVGHSGTGDLSIFNGAGLVSESANLGSQSAGVGNVAISGAGSSWAVVSGSFDVGGSGTGVLEILDGGLLQTPAQTSHIGRMASGSGNVMVSGAGSAWELEGLFWLGVSGSGQMTISNGGEVDFSGTSTLGQTGNASGELLIAGSGSRMSGTRLHVGNGSTSGSTLATGLLQLVDGGTLELVGTGEPQNNRLIIGSNTRSEGTVIVGAPSGAPPVGPGELLLAGGIGFNNGAGILLFNHSGILEMDFTLVGPVNGSGHVQAENGITLFSGAPIDYNGSLAIDENAVFGSSGQLGDVVNEGTLIASPGQTATLSIEGDYIHGQDAVIEIQFSPGPEIDLIAVGGAVTLQGGSVRPVVLPGDYGSEPLDGLYPILTAAGGLGGEFDQLDTGNPSAFELVYDSDTIYLDVSDQLLRDRFEP